MTTAAPLRRADAPPERPAAWRERSGRLYGELRRPAWAMIRRAFRGAFADDEIEDIYSSAWLGTLRALDRRHHELDDEEIRKYVLTAVAHHASKELRRRNRRRTAPLEVVDAVADHGAQPDESAAKLEQSRVTRDLLASLPPRRRAVMLLRYGWGLEPRQVCALVQGLSPRAYRKEITRGVDELTEKLGLLERGEWCADREPVLKAYAAGIADPEQERQAQRHLSHCRHCTEFVGRLSGHLHDVGASLAVPSALDAVSGDRLTLADRIGHLVDRVRDSAGGALGRSSSDGEAVSQAASLQGNGRGAGVAGGGLLAKLAGLGTAGKLAAVCLGGGAAATACLASGIVPARLPGLGAEQRARAPTHHVAPASPGYAESSGVDELRWQVEAPPPAAPDSPNDQAVELPPSPDPAPEPTAPIAPTAPPAQQEFGVASTGASGDSGGSLSSGGGGGSPAGSGSAVDREFGP